MIGLDVISSQDHHNAMDNLDYHTAPDLDFDKDVDVVVQGYDEFVNLYILGYASYCIQSGVSLTDLI